MSDNRSAINRLMKELDELKKNPISEISVGPKDENMLHWEGIMSGPTDTPYFGGVFKFAVDFNKDYPMTPPKVTFFTPIYHPNIDPTSGHICVDILDDKWSPSYTVLGIMLSVLSLLTDPNPSSPLNSQSARLYNRNRNQYNNKVKEWVRMYANP